MTGRLFWIYINEIIGTIAKILYWLIWEFIGLHYIVRKFDPLTPEEAHTEKPPVTVGIWIFGLYIAFFGLVSQRYQSKISVIENRINNINASLSTPGLRQALSRIPRTQKMHCPVEPELVNPIKTIMSLFYEATYKHGVDRLKETVADWKDSLSYAVLKSANLDSAELQGANLLKARLAGASLWRANLDSAILDSANLDSANFIEAYLQKAYLRKAILANAILKRAHLKEANLMGDSLEKADLAGADLRSANLSKSNLYKADLDSTNLDSANLDSANLSNASFIGASLKGANLSKIDLNNVKSFYMAKLDSNAIALIKKQCPEKLARIWDNAKRNLVIDSNLLRKIMKTDWQGGAN